MARMLLSAVGCGVLTAMLAAHAAFGQPFSVDALRGATVITVAGGGDQSPRAGAVATRVRLRQNLAPVRTALLDDGTPVFTAHSGGFTRLFAVGRDGRLRALPLLPWRGPCDEREARRAGTEPVADVASAPGGALLATGGCSGFVYRLAAGAAAWEPVVDLREWPALVPLETQFGLGGQLDDGSLLIAGGQHGAWRWLAPAGPLVVAAVPGIGPPDYLFRLTPLRGGGFAYINSGNQSVGWVGPDGASATTIRKSGGLGIAPTPDGRVLVIAPQRLLLVGRTGTTTPITARSGLRGGSGGRAGDLGGGGSSIATAVDGSALIGVPAGPPSATLDYAVTLKLLALPGRDPAVWGGIDKRAYTTFRRGVVVVRSSIAGRARLVLQRYGRRSVIEISRSIKPGVSRIQLRSRPPIGEYALRLDIDGSAGSFSDRTTIVTRQRLSLARARAAANGVIVAEVDSDDGGAVYNDIGACRRFSATRITCLQVEITELYDEEGNTRVVGEECLGRIAVEQTPDGAHARWLQGCRLV